MTMIGAAPSAPANDATPWRKGAAAVDAAFARRTPPPQTTDSVLDPSMDLVTTEPPKRRSSLRVNPESATSACVTIFGVSMVAFPEIATQASAVPAMPTTSPPTDSILTWDESAASRSAVAPDPPSFMLNLASIRALSRRRTSPREFAPLAMKRWPPFPA